MADDGESDEEGEDERQEPAIELGEGEPVEGAPLARVTSRLHYGIEHSEVRRREGDAVVRTPDGPRELGDILDETDETYFDTRRALGGAVREVIGDAPVPTGGGSTEPTGGVSTEPAAEDPPDESAAADPPEDAMDDAADEDNSDP